MSVCCFYYYNERKKKKRSDENHHNCLFFFISAFSIYTDRWLAVQHLKKPWGHHHETETIKYHFSHLVSDLFSKENTRQVIFRDMCAEDKTIPLHFRWTLSWWQKCKVKLLWASHASLEFLAARRISQN